ncbi:MAG TPA: hypothetical protein VF984_15445 [Actinomycetota bacterium]
MPPYCGVHSNRDAYVYFSTGEEELYELQRDRFELRNRAGATGYRTVLRRMRLRVAQLCDTAPPRMSIPF